MASASASRYARAVFEVASAAGEESLWSERLGLLRQVLADERTRMVLDNPSLPPARRLEVVAAVVPREAGEGGLNLARMLVAGRRVGVIGEIAEEFERLVDEAAGRVRATATTAIELPEPERRRLARALSEGLEKDVRLEVRVDPAIVGGLVLQVGDRVVDASLAARFRQLRRRLAAS